MNPQVELAQAFQRNEVHALDQLAQFRAQIFSGVALQGLLQLRRQPPIGIGRAGMQLHGLGRDFGQQGDQFLPARFQRRGSRLQGLQVDHALHEHDLGPFQLPADLDQLLPHGGAFALDHASVFLGGFLITRHRHGDRLGRDQMCLYARQHAPLDRRRGDDLVVAAGGGTAVVMAAADVLAALQRYGGGALVALHQAGQQPLGFAAVGGGQGRQLGLATLDAFPQLVIDNAQVWRGLADPVLGRVQDGRPFACIGVLTIAAAVEHARADIEFLVQDAILGAAVTVDGRRRPRPAARPGFACGVQAVGDGAGRFTSGVTFEDRTDHACLTCVDRQFAFSAQIVPVAAASAGEAVLDASDKAAAGLVAELGQEHLVHRALQADVEFAYVSF